MTASIGVAVVEAIEADQDSAFAKLGQLTGEELIAQADKALYKAKRAGKNGFAVLG